MEAHVPEDQWDALERAFGYAMKHRPDALVLSLLAHDSHDTTLWRVLTVWESHDALEAYYGSNTNMPSAYAFHLVSIVPTATLSEVAAYV
jgi:hypothetical protein